MKDDVRPKQPHQRPQESILLLKKELRRRGMTDADIDQTLRKKRRRKSLEFDLVISKRAIPPEKRLPPPSQPRARAREARLAASPDICTVDVAADLMGVHPKTALRFIRSGQLPARRVGKSYRIGRADLEAFSGVPQPPRPTAAARMTSIIDVPDVGPPLARKWTAAIASAVRSRPVTADVVHDPARRQLKIVLVGAADDTAGILGHVQVLLTQLK